MTEQEWLTSNDLAAMLEWIRLGVVAANDDYTPNYAHCPIRVSNRKLRLFAVACCRQVWDVAKCVACNQWTDCKWCKNTRRIGGLTDPRSRKAVEVAERYADGEATAEEIWEASIIDGLTIDQLLWVSRCCGDVSTDIDDLPGNPATQAALLREIVGNPWRPVKLLTCSRCEGDGQRHGSDRPFEWTPEIGYPGDCLVCGGAGWDAPYRTPTILAVARTIYEERRFEDMPILADALEEAGCTDKAVLRHCRGEEMFLVCKRCGRTDAINCKCDAPKWIPLRGPHVRGCWVLDLILGKN